MDAYAWYTINREAQDRLQDRINAAEQHPFFQQLAPEQPLQRSRLRQTLGKLLIAAGTRLQAEEAAVNQPT